MKLKILRLREARGDILSSSRKVAEVMAEEAKADRECFWVLHLNMANELIEKELVSMGTVNYSLVHPREVFKKAIINGVTSIITVHNHPGGQVYPSKNDRASWQRLDEAGKVLGIEVLDHIVITPSGAHYSEKEQIVKKGE